MVKKNFVLDPENSDLTSMSLGLEILHCLRNVKNTKWWFQKNGVVFNLVRSLRLCFENTKCQFGQFLRDTGFSMEALNNRDKQATTFLAEHTTEGILNKMNELKDEIFCQKIWPDFFKGYLHDTAKLHAISFMEIMRTSVFVLETESGKPMLGLIELSLAPIFLEIPMKTKAQVTAMFSFECNSKTKPKYYLILLTKDPKKSFGLDVTKIVNKRWSGGKIKVLSSCKKIKFNCNCPQHISFERVSSVIKFEGVHVGLPQAGLAQFRFEKTENGIEMTFVGINDQDEFIGLQSMISLDNSLFFLVKNSKDNTLRKVSKLDDGSYTRDHKKVPSHIQNLEIFDSKLILSSNDGHLYSLPLDLTADEISLWAGGHPKCNQKVISGQKISCSLYKPSVLKTNENTLYVVNGKKVICVFSKMLQPIHEFYEHAQKILLSNGIDIPGLVPQKTNFFESEIIHKNFLDFFAVWENEMKVKYGFLPQNANHGIASVQARTCMYSLVNFFEHTKKILKDVQEKGNFDDDWFEDYLTENFNTHLLNDMNEENFFSHILFNIRTWFK